MPTVVKEPEGKVWPLAPEGVHRAVCVDVHPVFTEDRPIQYGGGIVDRTRLVWQLEDVDENGVPYEVAQKVTASLHEKAKLRKLLESWRGRAFTPDELKGFDLDTVIGASCQLQLLHNVTKKDGKSKTYANIQAIMPLPKGSPKVVPAPGYVRKQDRAANPGQAQQSSQHEPGFDDDEAMGVPF
jgi:hypothetical protein